MRSLRSTSGCADACACVTGNGGAWLRTKVRHLLALGVSTRQAMQMAQSSKSCWRLSKSPAIRLGMTHLWLKEQGLISVRALWMKAHGYA